MKFIKSIALVSIILLICKKSNAQDTLGILKLYVYPDSVQVLVDDSIKTLAKSALKLKHGTHNISVKGKDLKPYYKSFIIKADSIHTMYITMKRSDEYIKYNKQMFYYKLKKNSVKYGGAFLPFGLAGLSYLSYYYSNKTADEYRDAHNLYLASTDVNEMQTIKKDADYLISKYNRQYYGTYILAGTAIITSYLYLKYHKKIINNIKKPIYSEKLSSNFYIDRNNNYHFSINYKF